MRTRARREPGSQLAFLDVMACGLGAVILLFLIVKHHTGDPPEPPGPDQAVELAMLRAESNTLASRIRQAESEPDETPETPAPPDPVRLAALERELEEAKARNAELRQEVETIAPERASDLLATPEPGGEEEYLLGLRVEGERIAILLDRSASMTDEDLIDIITRKIGADLEKQRGPKWQRTLRVARWLLQRLPRESEVAVVAFSDEAKLLGGGQWVRADDRTGLQALLAEIQALVPAGATNLEAGLQMLRRLSPAPTDLHVVTDGLPTKSASTRRPKGCTRKDRTRVSGECRLALFNVSRTRSAAPRGAKVNIILLPLQGDPQAAPSFWDWAAGTGGMLLAPAAGWP